MATSEKTKMEVEQSTVKQTTFGVSAIVEIYIYTRVSLRSFGICIVMWIS